MSKVTDRSAIYELDLTRSSFFKLGFACGSFSVGEIDQGIHIVLPTTNGENSEFELLFRDYFGLIPPCDEVSDDAKDSYGLLYIGAVAAFCRDWNFDIDFLYHIEAFEAAALSS